MYFHILTMAEIKKTKQNESDKLVLDHSIKSADGIDIEFNKESYNLKCKFKGDSVEYDSKLLKVVSYFVNLGDKEVKVSHGKIVKSKYTLETYFGKDVPEQVEQFKNLQINELEELCNLCTVLGYEQLNKKVTLAIAMCFKHYISDDKLMEEAILKLNKKEKLFDILSNKPDTL